MESNVVLISELVASLEWFPKDAFVAPQVDEEESWALSILKPTTMPIKFFPIGTIIVKGGKVKIEILI